MMFPKRRLALLAILTCLILPAAARLDGAEGQAKSKPILLYSRYFNAEGEDRYLPNGNFKDVLGRLGADFQVRVHNKPLTPDILTDVRVLLIVNPSDKAVGAHPAPHHFSLGDVEVLARFVQQGGGLIVMENQENHNLEVDDTNKLLTRFGIQATNLYTDAKQLVLPKSTPVIGGLRWAYYTGNLLVLNTSHPAKPRALVMNDLKQKPIQGPRDTPGVLLATAQLGKGRVVVATDSGWIADFALNGEGVGGVAIKEQDNWEIFHRLARWTVGEPK